MYFWIASLTACSPAPTDKMLFDAATDSANAALTPAAHQQAATLFYKVYESYPASSLAGDAVFQSAKALTSAQQLQQAIERFAVMREKFPSHKDAPLALFLTGFIYNNDLQDSVKAKEVYQTFLSQYPAHELAMSARFELETMGKPPEEVVPKVQLDTSAHGVHH
ncbi:MAG: tetratricopeptide repeat protein [Rhizobacter sp.]|nr:tetratricopeptide repeat protein [Chlorobiales bacterium]